MFQGFSKQTIDFLWGIRLNNDKSWFLENRDSYVNYVQTPIAQLSEILAKPFLDNPELIVHVPRIYRNAQYPPFLHYRDNMWISIRHDVTFWSQNPSLVFEISPEGGTYGFTLWKPEAQAMERFRQSIIANPSGVLNFLTGIEKQTGVTITGECYKRAKPCPIPEAERFFQLKSVEALVHTPVGRSLFTPRLAGRVLRTLEDMLPLNEYFQDIVGHDEERSRRYHRH